MFAIVASLTPSHLEYTNDLRCAGIYIVIPHVKILGSGWSRAID